MKRTIIIETILAILFLQTVILSQEMWELPKGLHGIVKYSYDFDSMHIDSIKNIVLQKELDSGFPDGKYYQAIEYLYRERRKDMKDFLLENLNTKLDTTLFNDSYKNALQWGLYYTDKFFLGLLGEREIAIRGMDSVALYSDYKNRAIINLADAGIYNFYEYVKERFLEGRMEFFDTFGKYGNDERYKNEVINLLTEKAHEESSYKGFMKYAALLGNCCKEYYIDLVNEKFRNTYHDDFFDFYMYLDIIDKDGTVERTKYILNNAVKYSITRHFLVGTESIKEGYYSKDLLSPNFIFFLKNVNLFNIPKADVDRNSFLNYFEPFNPHYGISTTSMLDTLTSYTNQSYGYDWLRDEAYKNELLDKIETAKNYLSSADSVNCAIEMKKFQNNVAEVYEDSAGSYPEYISNEGYKFLYYYSGYILDRLPELPNDLPVKLKDNNNKKATDKNRWK